MKFVSVTSRTYVRTYVLAEIWTWISCLALMRSATSAMLSIFGRAGAILLAVVDVSHALYA